ncbi:MAG TPA: ABC transporter permease [Candidatus Sulfotelmatobacter sp.]|nr:ABC transporter permease [Candidatus Sulfotelmatobacter sp.]
MKLPAVVRSFASALFHRSRIEGEMDEELRFHIENRAEDLERSGVPRAEAERRARIEFGGLERFKEEVREERGGLWLGTLWSDVRFGLRMLRKNPGFTAVAVLTLALGIGANTTIFSWVRCILLNPLPGVGDPERIAALETVAPNGEWLPTSYLDFRDLRDNCKLTAKMSVTKPLDLAAGDENAIERVWGEGVSGNFFDLLQVTPELGRFFSTEEVDHQQNAHPLVVIGHSYWTSHFHADPSVIGATLRINHFPYTIIGVAPPTFGGSMGGFSFEMWVPATMYGQLSATGDQTLVDRKWRTFRVLARLAPGVSLAQARAEVQSHAAGMAHDDADTNEGMSATLLPLWKAHYGIQSSLLGPLSILTAACGVILLIVCANIANLLLARATVRQKEFSIRLALGAPRSRLVRQLVTESLLISILGALAGLIIVVPLAGSLGYLLPHSSSSTLVRAPIDSGVLLFMIAVACAAALLAGIVPAMHASKGKAEEVLKERGRAGTGARSKRLLGFFVTSEVALALVALIGAGLFVRSFRHVSEIRPGFDPEHVVVAQLDLSAASYNAQEADSYCLRYRERLEHQPGVSWVTYADYIPLSVSAGSWEDLQIQGYVPSPSENMKIYRTLAAPGYFDLMKIPLLQGRDFNLHDDENAAPVMIVNQEFVRRFIPSGTALGRRVQGWGKWFAVVGVVQDSKIYRLNESPTPYFYVPIRQIYRPEMGLAFFIRTSAPIDSAATALRREAQAVDPAVPVFDTTGLNDSIAASLFEQRISANLLSILGSVALLLAAVGLYGVIGYSVAQRTNEIGIRMALGAEPSAVMRLVVGEGMKLAIAGVAIGLGAALGLTRLISGLLFGVSATDPLTFAGVAILLAFVALAAAYIPARRAMRVDPMIALREE